MYSSTPINTRYWLPALHTEKMNQRIRKHIAFLKLMLSANSAQQKLIVKSLTNEIYDVISEIALNIYTGRYHLTKKYINQLELYQLYIRSLGSREVGTKQKPWILLKHLTIICNIMLLKPIVHHLEKKIEWREKWYLCLN